MPLRGSQKSKVFTIKLLSFFEWYSYLSKQKQTSVSIKLTPEEIAMYRAAARRKWQETQPERIQRQKRAWELAQSAAVLLKEQFKATKVMVFGSLVRNYCFTLWSDVDIAAWGISPNETLRAMEAVRDLDEMIEVNLVDVETCTPVLLANIEQEGMPL